MYRSSMKFRVLMAVLTVPVLCLGRSGAEDVPPAAAETVASGPSPEAVERAGSGSSGREKVIWAAGAVVFLTTVGGAVYAARKMAPE